MLDWKSTRIPRVVRSTLAGEVYAADDAKDRGILESQILSEVIFGKDANLSNLKLKYFKTGPCSSQQVLCFILYVVFFTFNKQLTLNRLPETFPNKKQPWLPGVPMIPSADRMPWSIAPPPSYPPWVKRRTWMHGGRKCRGGVKKSKENV